MRVPPLGYGKVDNKNLAVPLVVHEYQFPLTFHDLKPIFDPFPTSNAIDVLQRKPIFR
jgi:hypothetical protein